MKKNNEYYKNIEQIIIKAGKNALMKWRTFNRQDSMLKGKRDLVTEVDLNTEKYLIKEIKKKYPNHGFWAEESGKKNYDNSYIWFIDPIDGTTNFSIKNPLWSISIGLAYKKEIIFGMVYIPTLNELFFAEKNKGAYLNEKKITLDKRINTKKIIHTYCHGSGLKAKKQAIKYYTTQKMKYLDCRQLGSAAIECSYVASGRIDSLVIPGVNAWDVAAGSLIALEAGACVMDFKGKDWSLKSSEIAICHPKIKNDIVKTLKKISS